MLKITIQKGEKIVTVYLATDYDKYLKPAILDPQEKDKFLQQLGQILFDYAKQTKDEVFVRAVYHPKQATNDIALLIGSNHDVTQMVALRGTLNNNFETDSKITVENFTAEHNESVAKQPLFKALSIQAKEWIESDLKESNLQKKIDAQKKYLTTSPGLADYLSEFIAEEIKQKINPLLNAFEDTQADTDEVRAYKEKARRELIAKKDQLVDTHTKSILGPAKLDAQLLINSIKLTQEPFEQQTQLATLQDFVNEQRTKAAAKFDWVRSEIQEATQLAGANLEKLKEITAKIDEAHGQLNHDVKNQILEQLHAKAKVLVKGENFSGLPEQIKTAAIIQIRDLLKNALDASDSQPDYLDYAEILVLLTGSDTDIRKLKTEINAEINPLQKPAIWQKFEIKHNKNMKSITELDDLFSTINSNLAIADQLNEHLKQLAAIHSIKANYLNDDIQSIIRKPGFSATDFEAQIQALPEKNVMTAQVARLLENKDKIDPNLLEYIEEVNANYNKQELTQQLLDRKRDIDEILLCHDYVNSIFNFQYWNEAPWDGEKIAVEIGGYSYRVPIYIADMAGIIKNADPTWANNANATRALMIRLQDYARANKLNMGQENELHLGFLNHIAPPAQNKPQPQEISSSLRKKGILPADQTLADQQRINETTLKLNIWQRNPNLKKTLQGIGIGLAIGLPVAAVVGFFLWPVLAVAATVVIAAVVAVGIATLGGIIGRAISKARNKNKAKAVDEQGSWREVDPLLGADEPQEFRQSPRQPQRIIGQPAPSSPPSSPRLVTVPPGTSSTRGLLAQSPTTKQKTEQPPADKPGVNPPKGR